MTNTKLYLASNWAFDVSGAQEIRRLIESIDANLRVTYSSASHLFIIESDISIDKKETAACIALFQDFIEKHSHEDLLDAPPIRSLEKARVRDTMLDTAALDVASVDEMLALNKNFPVVPLERSTQTWQPSVDLEYFASDRWRVLPQLAMEYNTEISVETSPDEAIRIRVSGRAQSDVTATFARLAALEKPMRFVERPYRGLFFVAPHDEAFSFQITRYSSLSETALGRVLVDPASMTVRDLPGLLAPVMRCHDMIVSNVQTPLRVQLKSQVSRAWQDFHFPGIGNPNVYAEFTAPRQQAPNGHLPSIPEATEPSPFLSNAKAQQVDKWKQAVPQVFLPTPESQNQTKDESESSGLRKTGPGTAKLPPGIKARKVLPRAEESSDVGTPNSPEVPKVLAPKPGLKVTSKLQQPATCTDKELLIDLLTDTSVIVSKTHQSPDVNLIDLDVQGTAGLDTPSRALPSFSSSFLDQKDPLLLDTCVSIKPLASDSSKKNTWIELTSPARRTTMGKHPFVPDLSASSQKVIFTGLGSTSTEPAPAFPEVKIEGKDSSLTTACHGNGAGSGDLQCEAQTSSDASTRTPSFATRTHKMIFQASIPGLQVLVNKKAEGNVQERLATNQETARVLHSVMRNKAPRRREVGRLSPSKTPVPAAKSDLLLDLDYDFPPLSGMGFQPKPQTQPRRASALLSTEQIHRIKSLFNALEPLLEAASAYPGSVSLEFQLGLVLIPQPSQNLKGVYKDLDTLRFKLLPPNGLPAPATIFCERVTTSPADIDHIVGLQVHGVRLFVPEPIQREIKYEFHCGTETGDLIIVIDSDSNGGKCAEIRSPSDLLGSVHISFPGHIWDAAVVVRGSAKHSMGVTAGVEEEVQHIVEMLWVEPGRDRVHLFTSLLKNKLLVKKVLVKRYTWYRHHHGQGNESLDQDLLLQVTEIQDLIVHRFKNGEVLEAYCAPLDPMVKAHRQWWEVSLISPAINSVLEPKKSLLPGAPKEWSISDLFGDDTDLVSNNISKHPVPAYGNTTLQVFTISERIGSAGLGNLLSLTETVVGSIDAVGYSNSGPGAAVTAMSASYDAFSDRTTGPPRVPAPAQNMCTELGLWSGNQALTSEQEPFVLTDEFW